MDTAAQPAAPASENGELSKAATVPTTSTTTPIDGNASSATPQAPAQAPAQTPSQQNPRQYVPQRRDRSYHSSLGPSLNSGVKQSRVLMVGAGGIGCELLKNIVLTGFGEVHIVDLDTIDLSNLNRQFLFRHEHIKKSKALVAKQAAQSFNPNVKIEAYHANIKDAQFNVRWFRGFNIVFNALDNVEARRHVNRMCLAADVPLIESGTTGFNGNVQVIKKGVTACYDCTEKPVTKSYPVCTIRSTPSQPIHCIVWGKNYLLSEIFGTSEDDAAYDHSDDADNANEIAELKKEAAALRKIREALGTEEFPRLLFDKVFTSDIVRLLSMEDMWTSRKKPDPLDYDKLLAGSAEARAAKDDILRDDQRVWSLEENMAVFIDSLERLSKRMLELRKAAEGATGPEPIITFDKDDEDTLDFVTAAANMRASLFGIERKSRFDIKEMAGNIIPAIATTNAIVAGLCVLQAFKILKSETQQTKELFLAPGNLNHTIGFTASRRPNPNCPVCSVYQTSVAVDLSKATLNDLVERIIKVDLGYGDKEFAVSNEIGPLYDPEETENLSKKLSELGIKSDSFLTVIDEEDEDTFVNVVINIEEATDADPDKPVKTLGPLGEQPQIPRKPKKEEPAPSNGVSQTNGKHSLDTEDANPKSAKRARPADEGDSPQAKKAKVAATSGGDDDIIVIDDAPDDAMVILDD